MPDIPNPTPMLDRLRKADSASEEAIADLDALLELLKVQAPLAYLLGRERADRIADYLATTSMLLADYHAEEEDRLARWPEGPPQTNAA